MKSLIVIVFVLSLAPFTRAQPSLAQAEALKQMYHAYNESTKTAQWVCSKQDDHCWTGEEASVSIKLLLVAEVSEDSVEKTYVVTSAKPAHAPGGYECHLCAPAIGAAVFDWHLDHWSMKGSNPSTGLFGSFGEPADVDLVAVGPSVHGIMLTTVFGGQGYFESAKTLLILADGTIKRAWSLQDELGNSGAYDPTDEGADHFLYHSSAGARFFANDEQNAEPRKYYEIEVISRGKDRRGPENTIRQENWTEIYRFNSGLYELLSRRDFTEIRKRKPSTRPR